MLGGLLKIALSFTILFLFVTLAWEASIVDALPALGNDESMMKPNEDGSRLFGNNIHTGANVVKRSLHSIVNQQKLLDRTASSSSASPFSSSASPFSSSSSASSHSRRLKTKFNSKCLKTSPNLFQSTGTYNKNLRAAKRMKAALDNRLKRFRMLDQDEFQEMLKSLNHQTSDEQLKAANGMDTIGGMELANYWSPI